MSASWQPSATLDTIKQRSDFLHSIREFFRERDVLEVQTPVLATHTVTDVAIDSIEVPGYGFLQTSPEYLIKRLLAGGMSSCYQMGPVFRAGERGRWHNPEFTMLEWYRLDMELADLCVEVSQLVDRLLGPAEYQTLTLADLLGSAFDINPHIPDESRVIQQARNHGLVGEHTWREALDFLVDRGIATQSSSRVFLVDYPDYMCALARCEQVGEATIARRFELVIDGIEIANAYDELLDASEFESRAQRDSQERSSLGKSKVAIDHNLVAAMESGLPNCCGVAVGVDRLFALAIGAQSIDEVLAFPLN